MLNVQESINAEISRILADSSPTSAVPTISSEGDLVSLGFTSLMFAELLICLEDELGVDPFQGETSIVEMRTIGDLINAYDTELKAKA